jgi:hypothetical protein
MQLRTRLVVQGDKWQNFPPWNERHCPPNPLENLINGISDRKEMHAKNALVWDSRGENNGSGRGDEKYPSIGKDEK